MPYRLLTLLPILLLVVPAAANAVIPDDEDANDSIESVAFSLAREGDLGSDHGILALQPGDVDYVGLLSLDEGDVVTASTTPLQGEALENPDTVLGLFDDSGTLIVIGDDVVNDDDTIEGLGSLVRFKVDLDGDYFVGVTGVGDTGIPGDEFVGDHDENGSYVLSITIADENGQTGPLVWIFDSTEDQVLNSGVGDGSTDSTATGRNILVYDRNVELMTFYMSWSGLGGGGLTMLHVHGPAAPNESIADHLFEFFNDAGEVTAAGLDPVSDEWTETRFVPKDSAILQTLIDGDAYVNVHSGLWPIGEIRGNLTLVESTSYRAWQFESSESQVLNSGVGDGSTDSSATGYNFFVYDPASELLVFTMSWNDLQGDGLTQLHVHGPATPDASTTDHLFEFFNDPTAVTDAGLDRVSDVWSATRFTADESAILEALINGEAYVNVHSGLWPMGEIRGNLKTILDSEPDNDDLMSAPIVLEAQDGLVARSGILALVPDDVDYLAISMLIPGDVITAVTSPLEDDDLEIPDTVIATFDDEGNLLVVGDDAENDDESGAGFGSLIRYVVQAEGMYLVGITGINPDEDFDPSHEENGRYVLSMTVAPVPEPSASLLAAAALLSLAGLARRRRG